ncbi:Uncharacterized conserved protein [Legionella beliardensis]|uniref:Uncharacterized conserved protein n=1 Tax=Legionella beliardensis TaxID=91822 RepID=A0A378JPH7_9GAMM|nr:PepSY domain-containing protein [Legionella beliardensis]STX55664.1 Uncharacterized conserved protein [Legionella beliardensis]
MKINIAILTALILANTTAFADSTQPQVSIQQAISAAEKAGYTDIRKIEYEHGQWEVRGRNAQGNKFEVKINAATGALTKDED